MDRAKVGIIDQHPLHSTVACSLTCSGPPCVELYLFHLLNLFNHLFFSPIILFRILFVHRVSEIASVRDCTSFVVAEKIRAAVSFGRHVCGRSVHGRRRLLVLRWPGKTNSKHDHHRRQTSVPENQQDEHTTFAHAHQSKWKSIESTHVPTTRSTSIQ